ncbi:MG2 domain-containing protein [Alistipes sp.]|uniref:alpha-2-macroglobulin family protein n=1 Tax=Alistipes sp. TaxID=1872444 RepID=UPI0025C2EF22|nr:MG2 domain-containing protein [Alistipes sp.]
MKPFRTALFALIILLSAACSRPASDIVESSTNGLSGVRMPIQVTLREGVELAEEGLEEAVSFTPSADVAVCRQGPRMLHIVPKSPLKSDTRYKVTLNASKLTGGKAKGIARFEFATPKLRFTYTPCWLQQSDDRNHYVLVGEAVSSDYADAGYVEQRFDIEGLPNPEVTWTHSGDGTIHKYRIENIPIHSDKDYTLDLAFDLDPKRSIAIEVPRKGEYIVLGHSVQTEPLAVVVTFSEPLKPNQDFRNLIRFAPKFRTSVDRNRLYIYPETQLTGNYEVEISREVQNKAGKRLDESCSFTASLPSQTPAIRFTSNGSILPSSNRMSLLFESVNFARARVRVQKIFANNLLQFFQRNYYGDTYFSDMEYVSRVVRDTTFDLGGGGSAQLDRTNSYSLDLSRLITDSRKSMYLLEIKGVDPLIAVEYNDYDYCFGDYRTYAERSKVVLQSDIGIICKSNGDGELVVYTTDLVSARPKNNCKVRAYDRQNQQLAQALTDSEGRAVLKCGDEPYMVLAEADGDVSFVRVEQGGALSLSNFDAGGTTDTKGIKGYLFGERGVWRPGDEIFLTLIVASDTPLPEKHPASLEFYNPNGQLVQSMVSSGSTDGIHTFRLQTKPSSPTGIWRAKATFGGVTFEKNIRVDAVKPNRMKIEMHLGDGSSVAAKQFTGRLTARWLHGAPAAGSKVTLQAQLSQTPTRFKAYPDYSFDDDTKQFAPEEREIVSGMTDAGGTLQLTTDGLSSLEGLSPGMLNGKFTVKVFEKSGDFSVDQQIAAVSPYDAYFGIGVTTRQSAWGEEYLDSKRDHVLRLVLLDARGHPVKGTEEANVTVYRMQSFWWWDASSPASRAHYAKSALNAQYKTLRATLSNGTGQVTMHWSPGDYGCYLIRVTGKGQAHSATCVVRVSSSDYPGAISSVTDAATRLAISRDKDKYVPGDRAKITIPSSPGARALVSVESGSFVRESHWIACTDRQTSFEIPISEGMAPNVYVSVSLVQPHANTLNDAPIRLFGVLRLPVEDAGTRLAPVIEMPESVKPESEITIRVREQNGRRMSYVLALVDEGLLGLTRFKTPDPYLYFNATEALGVRTWDLFDHVIGAYGGRIEQLFAIGGDAELPNTGALRAQRFKPVVRFLGAEKLGAGKTNTHKIALPPYFGSVRVMVIASNGRAFGSAAKQVAVKKPLLVQATLPRVVSTDEEIELPVTVFALEKGVGKTDVRVNVNEAFSVVGPKLRSVVLDKEGEQVVTFRLKTGRKTGIGKVRVTAASSGDNSASEIEIDVREPNPCITNSEDRILQPGETASVKPLKDSGTARLELSSIPPIDLSRRLEYLVRYPHGCIEQITSGAFPQLYLPAIAACDEGMLQDIDRNVKSVLSRLGSYQLSNGAFAYWSGGTSPSEWGTVYAVHFMTEAEKYGYAVDRTTRDRALKYLRDNTADNPLTQAYAQYVLALGGTPDRGAMNRLRERSAQAGSDTQWLLAAAYALDGNRKVAEKLIAETAVTTAPKADPYDGTYNSPERQMAIVLMTQTLLGEHEAAFRTALKMSDILKKDKWLSTQSTAWMLNTLANFAATKQSGIDARVGREAIRSTRSIVTKPLNAATEVKNTGTGNLYLVVSQSYTPDKGEEAEAASGLKLDVRYRDMNGAPLDPRSVAVSTDFYAIVKITNTSSCDRYTDLALTHIVPAGWEITSERDLSALTHQDIRDDRVLSYFDLRSGESKEIPIKLTATYKGCYYLPSVYCEAMYDNSVRALRKGEWIEVVGQTPARN